MTLKRFYFLFIALIFTGSILVSGCSERAPLQEGDSNIQEGDTHNETAVSDSDNDALLKSAQRSGSVHSYSGKVDEIVSIVMGIESNIEQFPEIPFTSDNEIVTLGFEEVYIPEDSKESYSYSYGEKGDSGLTENGDEWLILYEAYDKNTGVYKTVIKVTFNDVKDIRDFSIYKLAIDTKKTRNRKDDTLVGYDEDISFRDGSAGRTFLKDLDDPKDKNILTGSLEVTHSRNYTTIKELEGTLFQTTVILNDPSIPEDDEIIRLFRAAKFINGVLATDELIPDPPIHYGEKPASGEYRVLVEFPEGELKSYSKLVDFEADQSGIIYEKWVFVDDSESLKNTKYNADGIIIVEGVGRDGTKVKGIYNKNEGTFERVITPPQEHPVKQIEEVGRVKVDENSIISGEIHKKITFKESEDLFEEDILFIKEGNIIKIHVENSLGGNGGIIITRNPYCATLDGKWTDKDGKVTDFVELHYADRTSKQLFLIDDPNTPMDPDVEGEIEFSPDGSGIGTIEKHNEDGTSDTYYIIFNGNGTGTVVDPDGNHHPFGY